MGDASRAGSACPAVADPRLAGSERPLYQGQVLVAGVDTLRVELGWGQIGLEDIAAVKLLPLSQSGRRYGDALHFMQLVLARGFHPGGTDRVATHDVSRTIVAVSWVWPANTSMDSGWPWALHSSPMTICRWPFFRSRF